MAESILKVLLALLILQALIKFLDQFLLKYEIRIRRIAASYAGGGGFLRWFDDVMLVLMLVLVGLLVVSGLEYLSFATGLVVGMTVIQVYFHRFNQPLPADRSPEPPVSPIKLMSYAIQATPARAWRELLLMTALFVWVLAALIWMTFFT